MLLENEVKQDCKYPVAVIFLSSSIMKVVPSTGEAKETLIVPVFEEP
jgi:hypothetical protein